MTERCKSMEDCIEWARKKFQVGSGFKSRCLMCHGPFCSIVWA